MKWQKNLTQKNSGHILATIGKSIEKMEFGNGQQDIITDQNQEQHRQGL